MQSRQLYDFRDHKILTNQGQDSRLAAARAPLAPSLVQAPKKGKGAESALSSLLQCRRLEVNLAGQLRYAGGCRPADHAKRAAGEAARRIVELRMVEDVVALHTQLQADVMFRHD